MKHIWAIARKELRGYFRSAVALLFLATFLVAVLLFFFFVERFFARNIADVRPLFDWLPLLLIFLVSALTMRLWSEEQKTGTMEVLLTLPVPIHRLVLGKFLASLILVAIALTLTLGLPITVSQVGDLDWGPVIGGYLAVLLLASTYLSVGLCVSAATENQIVALIGTAVVCFLLYLPGMNALTSVVSIETAEFLRLFGTGSRFESVARGVLDLRDLAYYAGLMAVFLTLNTVLLRAKGWGKGEQGRPVRFNATLVVALVAANVLALNIWLRPVDSTRIDLTKYGIYSLSPSTEQVLEALDEPLIIRGYFTSKIYEDVDPLVPQLKDLLREYKIEGGDKVRLEFVDPSKDEEVEREANEEFNIQALGIMSQDRHGRQVINAYFHVLVMYGSQFEVLEFQHLVRAERDGQGKPLFFLGNVEYEVTRAVRKVVHGFQSVESLFAEVDEPIALEAYVSRDALPAETRSVAEKMDEVARGFAAKSNGRLTYRTVDDPAEMARLATQAGLQPYMVPLEGKMTPLYFHWVVRMGDNVERVEVIADKEKATAGALRQSITNAVRRVVPGFIRVIGLVTPGKGPMDPQGGHMQGFEAPPSQTFNAMKQTIEDLYRVQQVDLKKGPVSDDIDVLIVAGPDDLEPRALLYLDQFLMRGGSLILLAAKQRARPGFWSNPGTDIVNTRLDDLLAGYGIELGQDLVMDPHSGRTVMKLGRKVEAVVYPLFPYVDERSLREGGIITSGLTGATMHIVNPIRLLPPEETEDGSKVETTVLMRSSKDSWLYKERLVRPDFASHPNIGFPRPAAFEEGDLGPHILAVAKVGRFKSPLKRTPAGKRIDTMLEHSPDDARLVVVASSSFVADDVLEMSAQFGMESVEANLRFIHNLVDWALEDTELLRIRAIRTTGKLDVDEDTRRKWEWANYVIALLGLAIVIAVTRLVPRPSIGLVHDVSESVPEEEDEDDEDDEDEAGDDEEDEAEAGDDEDAKEVADDEDDEDGNGDESTADADEEKQA